MKNTNDRDLSIVVLAAGKGTRMKSHLPKVLHRIGQKPMLAHVVDTAKKLNPAQIIVVYGFGGQMLKEAFKGEENLTWVEQPTQMGTGDAVMKAFPLITPNHRVLILYGDVPLISLGTLERLLQATNENSLGVLTMIADDPKGLGRIVRNPKGEIERIVEEKDASVKEREIKEVNTGIYATSYTYLNKWLPKLNNHNQQKEYYLTDIVQFAVEDNVSVVAANPDSFQEVLGINDRHQQVMLERYYQQRCAEQLLHQGVWICDPARFELRGTLKVQEDVSIDVNVVLEGHNVLGANCSIGPNCVLINCEIGENTKILANSVLENAKIGAGCVIGPFARIRPGTVLDQDVRIGNFVEIKNSTIAQGSKVNHLSYIGDTTMGKDVNIGAGTITCNYDGSNKHRTVIEDDVHIGSDSQLIAPIRIGKGATIGAGATLREDAPAFQLTLTHQLSHRSQDWTRPKKKGSSEEPLS